MTTPVPVALAGSGRKAVSVGVATFWITVPTGVFSYVFSCCVHPSEPGATPGHRFTTCAAAGPAARSVRTIPLAAPSTARRMVFSGLPLMDRTAYSLGLRALKRHRDD